MKIRTRTASMLGAAVLVATIAINPIAAQATPEPGLRSDQTSESAPAFQGYDEHAVLSMLFAGTGPLAEANPELLTYLGFAEERGEVDQVALDQLIVEFIAFDPAFSTETLPALQSGDPLRVEQGLESFTLSVFNYLDVKYDIAEGNGEAAMRAAGSGNVGAWNQVIAYAAALVNGALYANVAVATLAVVAGAAIFVVAIVTTYLSEGEMAGAGNDFEAQSLVTRFTDAMAVAR